MTKPSELFARSFERFFLFIGRHGECRVQRVPDTFDGHAYDAAAFRALTEPYLTRPQDFYQADADSTDVRLASGQAASGPYRLMQFSSPYRSGYPENDRAYFRWFQAEKRSRAVAILVPGWPRQDLRFEMLVARNLAKQGVDVALFTIPFQHERTPQRAYSGEYFISSNPLWTVENIRQAVAEIRLLVRWLNDYYGATGIVGLSSGGIVAGLAAHCENVDFCAPVMSASDLGGLMWGSSITAGIRAQLHAKGLSKQDLDDYWAILDLAKFTSPLLADRVLQVFTRYDGIIPLHFQESLATSLGGPERIVLDTSHFGIALSGKRLAKLLAAFIRRETSATYEPRPESFAAAARASGDVRQRARRAATISSD